MEIRILGSLQAFAGDDPEPVPVGGRRSRTLLAVLLCQHDQVVPTDTLVEEIWGEDPPRTAVETLHSYLSRLRRALEPQRPRGQQGRHVITHPGGYELRVDGARIDALTFEALVEQGAGLVAGGDPERGAAVLSDALERWRGTPLHDVAGGPIVTAERHCLEELRVRALGSRITAQLACGHHAQVIGELEALVSQHPLNEGLHASRILALYRSGRQADALNAFREAWTVLRERLGVHPSSCLRELQAAVLNQDPALDWHPATGTGAVNGTATSSRKGNLPSSLTTFVGRVEERSTVKQLLDERRLVTVTGLAGVGKTSLALAVADEASPRDGTWLVELADCADGSDVLPAVADLLEVSPRSGEPLELTLAEALRDRELLLVLDSCEHVRQACAQVIEPLLQHCGRLRVLATSRTPLDVHGEALVQLGPLSLPEGDDADEAAVSSSVRLFVDRAQLVQPGFALDPANRGHVVQICRRLGGLPLAIELAAARLRMLGVEDLARRLSDPRELLEASGKEAFPTRHRTLRAALDASCEHLDDAHSLLLRRLSVFEGGFPLDAVEAVCNPGGRAGAGATIAGLETLVDRSLVTRRPAPVGPSRYRLLPPIRRYAAQRMGPDEEAELGDRHASFFATLCDQAGPELVGPNQVEWFNRLHHEQGNVRAALRHALRQGHGVRALRIVGATWWFWYLFSHLAEGHRWLRAAERAAGSDGPAALRARVARGAGTLAWVQGAYDESIAHLRRALDLAPRDAEGDCVALTLGRLARTLAATGRIGEAGRLAAKGGELAEEVGGPWCGAALVEAQAETAQHRGDFSGAAKLFGRAEGRYHNVGDEWSACLARLGAARAARAAGQHAEAARLHRENLARSLDLTASTFDFIGIFPDLEGLARLAETAGDRDLALSLEGVAARLPQADGAADGASQPSRGPGPAHFASPRVSRIPSGWAAGDRLSLREEIRCALEATEVLDRAVAASPR